MLQHVDAQDLQQSQEAGFAPGVPGCELADDSSLGEQSQQKFMQPLFPQQFASPMKRQATAQTGMYGFGHEAAMVPSHSSSGFFAHQSGQ